MGSTNWRAHLRARTSLCTLATSLLLGAYPAAAQVTHERILWSREYYSTGIGIRSRLQIRLLTWCV